VALQSPEHLALARWLTRPGGCGTFAGFGGALWCSWVTLQRTSRERGCQKSTIYKTQNFQNFCPRRLRTRWSGVRRQRREAAMTIALQGDPGQQRAAGPEVISPGAHSYEESSPANDRLTLTDSQDGEFDNWAVLGQVLRPCNGRRQRSIHTGGASYVHARVRSSSNAATINWLSSLRESTKSPS
jgi:hypothetical protein